MSPSSLSGVFFDPARRSTPIHESARPEQVRNNTGGYVFELDDLARAKRFLILGSESSFYQPGSKLSLENAETLARIAKSDRVFELINLIVDVSVNGRAPKQSPGLFALAVVINQTEDAQAKAYAYSKVSEVARTGSTLFEFTNYLHQFQGSSGSGFQKAIARWYGEKDVDKLAYQLVKYRERNRMNHSRLLRLSKRVKSADRPELAPLLDWALGKDMRTRLHTLPDVVQGFELAKNPENSHMIPNIVREFGLSWEMLPTEALNDKAVWDALLDGNVPLGALIRQLPRLTNLGIIQQLGGRTAEIEDRLVDAEALKKARIHPLQALVAMRTYGSGRGMSQSWTPVRRIVDALEQSFYNSFEFVEPTGKTHMLALDVSASMTWSNIAGLPITPREASACMAMVQARIEREYLITAFSHRLYPINITRNTRLADAIKEIESIGMGATNLSLPMDTAREQNIPVDVFVSYTDNEVNRGYHHPFQALQRYRREMERPEAKLIVVGMTASRFSIADPNDPGMLDVAGFDTAAPGLMAEFVR